MSTDLDKQLSKQGRRVGVVIAVTMVVWLVANWVGPQLGMPGRFAFLFDFAAIAALIWALVVIFQIRRKRRENQR
ncbi:MAG: DUF5337 domain-containing protein [Paracoccaceae bacterium]|nr:DUF5337 domain-containing protein [Paracoccaceae bacterium]MDG1738593.1 DUF5337 domain-containing protein [Paracoccaceae bacterium]MDG2260337.1 DUF5337 domain-containing protein [Paracoccaceae bacterium]